VFLLSPYESYYHGGVFSLQKIILHTLQYVRNHAESTGSKKLNDNLAKDKHSGLFIYHAACFVCKSTSLTPIHKGIIRLGQMLEDPEVATILAPYEGQHFKINLCKNCKFIQPEAIPSNPNYFNALYSQKWSEEWMLCDFESTYKDSIFLGILRRLGREAECSSKRLLDVGAHVGKMIFMAGLEGWVAEGVELNPRTREIAIRKTNRPVYHNSARELAATGVQYDAITMTDVLEHIPDPVSILTDLYSLLKRGGTIAIKVPSGRNQLLKEKLRVTLGLAETAEIATNFIHVNHFSPTSLTIALIRAGFVQPRIMVGAPELPPKGGLRGLINRSVRVLIFSVAKLPGGVHSPFGLNLQAFAKKDG
jgi:2-polyprenyl-3-methyl-5-hydroxy-6-metoxy-1,4-benzoquinol methylase